MTPVIKRYVRGAFCAAVGVSSFAMSGEGMAASSVYTDITSNEGQPKGCVTIAASDPEDGGEWANVRCTGVAGADVYIDYADARDTIRVGEKGTGTTFLGPFTSLGAKVEWRMDNGAPYAMIARLILEGESKGNWLSVHKVDAATGTGCLYGYVDARANRNANELARQMADDARAGSCAGHGAYARGKLGDLLISLVDIVSEEPPAGESGENDAGQSSDTSSAQDDSFVTFIRESDCAGRENPKYIGAVPSAFCVVDEFINIHVMRVQKQTMVGLASLPEPMRPFPVPHRVSDKVHLLLATPELSTVWGGLLEFTLFVAGDDPDGERQSINGFTLIRAQEGNAKSCNVFYGEGKVTPAVIADMQRFQTGIFTCESGEAFWYGNASKPFQEIMRLMNVKFAA